MAWAVEAIDRNVKQFQPGDEVFERSGLGVSSM